MLKLDLHRKRHADARRDVIRLVEDNWGSGEQAEIITGNSLHMKKIVTDVLDEYSLDYRMSVIVGYITTVFE